MNPVHSGGQRLDLPHRIGRKLRADARQILLHVLAVGSPSQRQHPDCASKGKHNLGWSGVGAHLPGPAIG
jgi:hypothetical protein